MPRSQQRGIASLFARLATESPLIEPAADAPDTGAGAALAAAIRRATGLHTSDHRYAGWLGVECGSVRRAIWMMRAIVAGNVLARREGTVLFVPINQAGDPGGARVTSSLARVHRLAAARGVV